MVYEITPEEVQATLEKNHFVMLNFGAPWCIDCRRAEPFYKKFSEMFTEVTFTHTDINGRDAEIRPLYAIQHIPTMIFYKDGVEIDRIVEVQTPSELKAFIENCLKC